MAAIGMDVSVVNRGPASAVKIDTSMDLTISTPPEGVNGTQLWLVTGSSWHSSGPGFITATVTVTPEGGQPVAGGDLSLYANDNSHHYTFPTRAFITNLPTGNATVQITGTSNDNVWDSGDTFQVILIEMDHSGLGGGI